ncbi:MAG TPA: hypothetical protein VEK57_29720 [Thermoanaerobaculia bacterium]|nr:hypothetical protein [Thermoanaerobaculia bacterium]
MPIVDFRPEAIGGRPNPWPVPGTGFTVHGTPSVEIRDTSPAGRSGVTAYDELRIELPALAMFVAVDLIIGNAVTVEALDSGGFVVDSRTFAAGTGPAAAMLSAPDDIIQQVRMAGSGTEDRITIVFSS